MNRRQFTAGLCSCSAFALAACVTDSLSKPAVPGQRLAAETYPGYRPGLATDEGGLWAMMDRVEAETKTSRFLIRDTELNEYVRDIACRMAGDHCPDMRVYLTRTPYFNASMAPNGMMSIWSGLLLRVQNEAQLAAVVGHEIGHYMRRHSLQRFRDLRAKADFATFFSMGLAIAGLPAIADITQFILLASIYAYSREHEREADSFGLELMADAGYEPMEASKLWQQLIEEQKAKERPTPRDIVFASHPAPEERLETLRQHAAQRKKVTPATRFDDYRARYVSQTWRARSWMLRDEIRLRQYGPSLALFDQMLAARTEDGEVLYYKGEVYRLRNDGGDAEKALENYRLAVAAGGAPPEVYRSEGFLHQRAGNFTAAKPAFERYLELRPDADDRDFIRSYLERGGLSS